MASMTTPHPAADAPLDLRIRTVTSGAVQLHVEEAGDPADPTVVLVHGYPDTSAVWDRVRPDLAEDHHVVTYDVRGAGRSSRPAAVDAYAFRHLVADFAAVVDAVSPDAAVHLVGHDWGAIQGWDVAADAEVATRLTGFTAVSAPSLDLTGHWMRGRLHPRGAPALAAQLARSWYIAAFQVPGVASVVWRRGLATRWGELRRRIEADPTLPDPAPTLERDAVCGIRLYRANAGRVARPVRDRVHVPVRVLLGERDRFVGTGLFADLHESQVQVEVVAGAHHWLPLTHPAAIASAVRAQVSAAQ